MKKAITRELEVWVGDPEGVWDWLGNKGVGLKSMGSNLASREMYIYSKDCTVAKSLKLRERVYRKTSHILRVCFGTEWHDDGKFQGSFKLPKGR